MKIYIVQGSTGEYDDAIDWPVCAYESETKAIERIERLNNLLKKLKLHYKNQSDLDSDERGKRIEIFHDHADGDKLISCYYIGSDYNYYEVELIKD